MRKSFDENIKSNIQKKMKERQKLNAYRQPPNPFDASF
jgi:hypothetical protein